MIQIRCLSLSFFIVVTSLNACSDAEQMVEKYKGIKAKVDDSEYIPVPGGAASGFLSKTLSNSSVGTSAQVSAMDLAISDQAQTNLMAMGLMLDGSQTAQTASSDTFNVLAGGEKKKSALDPTIYQRLDASVLVKTQALLATDYTSDTVAWGAYTDTSFTIPALDRMPVRDQGRRGTCASFAGVGLIEALIIQASSASLPFQELDLSEQRFYYLSKPDSWGDGGSTSQQGSDSGTGFATSNGTLSGHSGPTDTGGNTYNIPLESNCRYNPNLGTNDLQTPQSDSCKTKGVVKVSKFTSWAGSKGTANKIERAQSIYNELRANKAVVVYTKLSSNWEKNDGLITYSASGGVGDTSHAAGHAYLIVGAKKIDETTFPGEGGMCFIIRNSWGTGWGAKGISCMTLTWFNHWRFEGELPTVDEVELVNDAKEQIKLASLRPANLIEPDSSTLQNRKGGSITKRKGKVVLTFMPDPVAGSRATPWHPAASSFYALTAFDPTRLVADSMSFGKLVTDNDQAYKMLYTANTETVVIRGIIDGDTKQTHNLELKRSGNLLTTDVTGRGTVTVGEFTEVSADDGSAAVAVVCGQQYASVCDLNYVEESNELIVGLSELEAKRQVSEPPYSWQSLNIAGYGFETSKPASSLTKFDVKLVKNGVSTNPQRLKLDPSSGNISHKGTAIGNLNQGSLCSGSFSSTCRVVTTDDKFEIFPKSK